MLADSVFVNTKSLACKGRRGNTNRIEKPDDACSSGQLLAAVQIAYGFLKLLVAALQNLQGLVLFAAVVGVVTLIELFFV